MTSISTEAATDGGLTSVTTQLVDLDATNLLVEGGPLAGKGAFVLDAISRAVDEGRDVLLITTTRSQRRRFENGSGRVHVVDCTPADVEESTRVSSVGSPSDLTGMSMPISKFMSNAGANPLVVLDSISSLLMYAETASAFRFLSVLTTQIRNNDGVGLFTVDAGCHEEQTVRTFAQLFDGRAELDGDRARVAGVPEITDEWLPA